VPSKTNTDLIRELKEAAASLTERLDHVRENIR
jgi:hypothetical protein